MDKVTLLGARVTAQLLSKSYYKMGMHCQLRIIPRNPSIILYEMDTNQEINPEDYTECSNSENSIDSEDYHDDCPSINEEQNGRGINGEQEIDNAHDNAQEEDNAHDNAQEEDNAHEQERHHEGRFSYSEIYDYLASHKYPLGFSKADKLALRKRSKFFQVKDGHLYYTGKCKLAIINSF